MKITKKHKDVVIEAIREIRPSKNEVSRVKKVQNEILKKISVKDTRAVLGGSGAKNTWLKDSNDIDIYVKFNYSRYKDRSDEISEVLYKSLKKKFSKITRLHGSRDYFQVNHKDYIVEIVPILSITKAAQAKNITDFSQFHVDYVNKKVNKKKKLIDEIRLAKVFAKANKIYGAESYIKGFSGYVLELLVIHYGSFLNLVKGASEWNGTTVIGNKKTAERLNWAKKLSPLRLIDPVQPDRNAAAALSKEQYNKFVKLCKSFMKKPSRLFFETKLVDVAKLKRKGYLIIIKAKPVSKKNDVAGAKALKAFQYIIRNLSEYGVVDSVFDYDGGEAMFYIVVKNKTLSKEYKQYGPPLGNDKALEGYKQAHKMDELLIDKKNKRYYVMAKRENPNVKDKISSLLKKEVIASRIGQASFVL